MENLRITQGTHGVILNFSSNAVVRGCQIYSLHYPTPLISRGIWSSGGFGNLIINNQLCNIMNAYGIVIDDNGHDVVDGNVLSQMYYAIDASSAGDTKIKNNTATAVTVKHLGGTQLPGTNF